MSFVAQRLVSLRSYAAIFRSWMRVTMILLFVFAFKTTAQAAPLSSTIHYTLRISNPTSQYVEVSMKVPRAIGRVTKVQLPAWIPGSYLIREFARHVYDMQGQSLDGKPLKTHRVDKLTWEVENQRRGFQLTYRVFANELSVRTSFLNDKMALLNCTNLLFFVKDQLNRKSLLDLDLVHPSTKDWSVHTALNPGSTPFSYVASNYDTLADSPILLGKSQTRKFFVGLTQIEYIVVAPSGTNADIDRLANEAKSFVTAYAKIMGGLPFSKYQFLVVLDEFGRGGLEHLFSTAMILPPWIFDKEQGYDRARRLGAHEFFHAWNVKRIRDRVLGPFDYTRENYSDLLWFHEGFTESMESIGLLRSQLLNPEDFLNELANEWNKYIRHPGRNYASIAQLSRDAWIKYYRPAANHRNTSISYYEKGKLIGVALDIELRLRSKSHGKQGSLERMFRYLWEQRSKKSDTISITRDNIIAAASLQAGEDMHGFFDRFVYGTEELELPNLLEKIGIQVYHDRPRARGSGNVPLTGDGIALWTGIISEGKRIASVVPGSPAAKSGLMIDDEILAVDGKRVQNMNELKRRLHLHKVGQYVEISVFRRNQLQHHSLQLEENPYQVWEFRLQPEREIEPEVLKLREQWLANESQLEAPHPPSVNMNQTGRSNRARVKVSTFD